MSGVQQPDDLLIEKLSGTAVIPVIRVESVEAGVELARTLVSAGLKTLEITLRTEIACEVIQAISGEVPDAQVGAGTVLNQADLERVARAGAQFAISPGATLDLYQGARTLSCPLIPGVATASELMNGIAQGYSLFKFFPAEAAGGVDMLKAWQGPFPNIHFIPTGGISPAIAPAYLSLPNVIAVGGSWMVPESLINQGDWAAIRSLAEQCESLLRHS